jgi:hypothetical protein
MFRKKMDSKVTPVAEIYPTIGASDKLYRWDCILLFVGIIVIGVILIILSLL